MGQYWFARDGQKFGPYAEEHVRARFAQGELQATDLVWTDGMPQWQSAAEVFGAVAPPATSSPYRPPAARVARETETGEDFAYAGFWVRFGAAVVDAFVLGVPAFLAAGALVAVIGAAADPALLVLTVYVVPILASWLYFAGMESGARSATLGKRAFHLQVLSADRQERIGFGRASARFFGRYLSMLVLYIGYLMQPFTARRQALHDLVAGTVVVSRKPAPVALVVITVIFALLFPIGGMLAAIAIPAYSDYTVRAKVSNALMASDAARMAVQEHLEAHDAAPRSLEEAGVRFTPTPQVRSIALDPRTAALTVTLGFDPLEGKTIVLAPRRDAERNVTWACRGGTAPAKYLPRSCRGG